MHPQIMRPHLRCAAFRPHLPPVPPLSTQGGSELRTCGAGQIDDPPYGLRRCKVDSTSHPLSIHAGHHSLPPLPRTLVLIFFGPPPPFGVAASVSRGGCVA